MREMWGWLRDLTDLVLPAECAGCGRPRTVLCPECRAVLYGAAPRRVCPWPEPPGLPTVHAAGPYRGEIRSVLLAHKERGALGLAGPLGLALAAAVRAGPAAAKAAGEAAEGPAGGAVVKATGELAVPGPVSLVPVPSARGAVRARGHDPLLRVARAAAGELRRSGTPARVLPVLRQTRPVADQAGLGARQRLANMAGALRTTGHGAELLAAGGPVVIVDDVMTTGASLAEAARAVYAARKGEHRGEPTLRAHRKAAGTGGRGVPGYPVHAAVVAASPDSFELNRN